MILKEVIISSKEMSSTAQLAGNVVRSQTSIEPEATIEVKYDY